MKKKILIIEDEGRLRELLASLLKKEGFVVLTAEDGEVGLKIIKEEKPDIVILDLILPKKDGFEVLDQAKASDETKDIPIVVLTNLEEKHNIERALSYGVRAYLIKANFKLEEVVEKVKGFLKQTSF
jgi:DNA-binding response OmpR family regulator